ncbi:MAG: hypothetical protein HYW63_04500 [Candidatus Levybacteria bacterium]|nr:hypothetical protein [Candidatus Levybacteria bacterium]
MLTIYIWQKEQEEEPEKFIKNSAFTIYQVIQPLPSIKGAATADYISVTEEEGLRIANASVNEVTRLVYVIVFRDPNANGRQSNTENCYDRAFTFTINSIKKTRKTDKYCDPAPGYKAYVISHRNCNKVTLNPPSGYRVTGYTYSDGKNRGRTVLGKRTVTLCGAFGPDEGLNIKRVFQAVDFGITKK